MKVSQSFLAGAGLGMTAMYMFDLRSGRRRRSLVRDQIVHSAALVRRGLSRSARDLNHRLLGLACEARGMIRGRKVSDPVLEARVRSKIGRVVSHPHAIHVECDGGRCFLTGPILSEEVGSIVACAKRVRGVRQLECRFDIHESAGSFSSLQGGTRRSSEQMSLFGRNWAPSTRLIIGSIGAGMTIYGGRRQDGLGAGMTLFGLGLIARSLTNMDMTSITGLSHGSKGIRIQKSLEIAAPVEQVYGFWTRFENFPVFMTHLQEVVDLGRGRSRWTAMGPGGIPVRWEAVVTQDEPNEMICWESVKGSLLENAGRIRFERCGDDLTRIHIQMSYMPPAGLLGHAVARMFAVDPKTSMDTDLIRMKSLFERGKTHVPGRQIRAEELAVRQSQTIGIM